MADTLSKSNSYVSRKPVGYLVPKAILAQNSKILKFEDICHLLVPVFKWRRGSVPKYCFVSHRWLSLNNPDNTLNTLSMILKIFATVREEIDYYWIDYMCLSHENKGLEAPFMDSMQDIIYNASELLIVPLSVSSKSSIPQSDLQAYCYRAWCAYEFSAFMDRPEDIVIAHLGKRNSELKVKFLKLPCAFENVKALIGSFAILKETLLSEEYDNYQTFYSTSAPKDMETVWLMLNNSRTHILETNPDPSFFSTQGFNNDEINVDNDAETNFEHHLYKIKSILGMESGMIPDDNNGLCECNTCSMM